MGFDYKEKGYCVFFDAQMNVNLLDSSTYYLGLGTWTFTATLLKTYIPITAKVKRFEAMIDCSVSNGSNEDVAFYLTLNNSTNNTITTTGKLTADMNRISNSNLNVDVSTSDYFYIKMVTPAFATNPYVRNVTGFLYLE
jgi:hypothetical protein